MISIQKVLEYIVNMTQNVLKSESIKEQLNQHERCEPYAIFSRIDREDKGFLIKEDFIRFLNENNVHIDTHRKTIDLFIEYYDRNFDEKLDFTEFLNFILNKEQNLSRSISSQRETYKIACDEYLEKDLENLIVQVLISDFYLFEYSDIKKIEIFLNLDKNINENEKYKNNNNNDTKLIDLFIKMDYDKDGLISCEDLYDFISKRKIKICQNELQNFIGLFDEDMDGFLDWNEFLFMILPSSSSFEYDLNSLQKQEEIYNQFYYRKNDILKIDNNIFNDNINYKINNENMLNNYNKNNIDKFEKINIINSKKDINGNQFYFDYKNDIYNCSNKNINNNTKDNYCYNKIDLRNNNNYKVYNNQKYIDNNQFGKLCQILYQIIDSEKNIEYLKNQLFSDNNFNLNKLFNYFDKYQNG